MAEKVLAGTKYDKHKLRWELVPFDAMEEIVARFTHGSEKYDDDNWKKVPNAAKRYQAAMMRHFSKYMQGEVMDPDVPELTHIGAVCWNALVLVWFQQQELKKKANAGENNVNGKVIAADWVPKKPLANMA